MHLACGLRTGLTLALFILLISTPVFAAEQSSTILPRGSRPATEADMAWLKYTGIQEIKPGMTINPDDPNIGQKVGEAKRWLSEHAVKNVKIRCLNPQFAIKLKAFMEAVPGGPPVITDAYRSEADQQRIINKGDGATRVGTPCGSYHPWGLAADLNQNNGSQTAWMRANAQKFGFGTLGAWDPNHIQDAQGKQGQCGACSADGPDGVLPPSSSSPSTGIANALRQLFGMPQQPVAQPQPIAPQQQIPQIQSPIDAFKTPEPAVNVTPTPGSSTLSPTATTSSIRDQLTEIANRPTVTTPSINDQLAQLAFGTPSISTATASAPVSTTSLAIVVDPSDVASLASTRTEIESEPAQIGSGAIAQQTFTTQDLSTLSGSPAASNNYSAILNTIKAALLRMKILLTPFAARGATLPSRLETVYLE